MTTRESDECARYCNGCGCELPPGPSTVTIVARFNRSGIPREDRFDYVCCPACAVTARDMIAGRWYRDRHARDLPAVPTVYGRAGRVMRVVK